MWKSVILCVIFSILVCWTSVELHNLPPYIKQCNRSESVINKCLEENIKLLKPKLDKGIPDLFIPSLDPLIIPPTSVNEEDQVKVTFTDIKIFHADDFRVDQFDIDLDSHKVNLTITFPQLRIKSTYNVNGKFLGVTFDEKGPADGNYNLKPISAEKFKDLLDLKKLCSTEKAKTFYKKLPHTITTKGKKNAVAKKKYNAKKATNSKMS